MGAELDEELIHVTKISGIVVGVEEGGRSHGVAEIDGRDLGAALRGELEHFHVLTVWEAAQSARDSLKCL